MNSENNENEKVKKKRDKTYVVEDDSYFIFHKRMIAGVRTGKRIAKDGKETRILRQVIAEYSVIQEHCGRDGQYEIDKGPIHIQRDEARKMLEDLRENHKPKIVVKKKTHDFYAEPVDDLDLRVCYFTRNENEGLIISPRIKKINYS